MNIFTTLSFSCILFFGMFDVTFEHEPNNGVFRAEKLGTLETGKSEIVYANMESLYDADTFKFEVRGSGLFNVSIMTGDWVHPNQPHSFPTTEYFHPLLFFTDSHGIPLNLFYNTDGPCLSVCEYTFEEFTTIYVSVIPVGPFIGTEENIPYTLSVTKLN